ncbi:MAG: FAD-dependent oxidoreductase [Nitrospirota bacterium]|nr:FAD-dependent oxidoreductase [Nitrospirota bacterium]
MEENRKDSAIVLGAGLAGLSAGYHGGFPVYEAANYSGGASYSYAVDGFVFDIGIHILQSKDDYFLSLLKNLNVDLVSRQRSGWIYSYGCLSRYPFQVNTSHLPWLVRARCVAGFIAAGKGNSPANYEQWMIQQFGPGFASTFLIPYAEKFWGCSPSEMTFEWVGNRVPRPRLTEVIKGMLADQETKLGTHAYFQYPSDKGVGFAAIARALEKKIEPVHYRMKATGIDPQTKTVIFNDGEKRVGYRRLISTIPLPELIRLLPQHPAEVKTAVERLRHNSIAVVNLGINRAVLTDKHWVHFPEKDISFFRISFPGNFTDGLNPPETSSIQAEVSYDAAQPPEREELLQKVISDLVKTGIIDGKDEILVKDVFYQKYGYVVYDHHRRDSVKTLHDYLNSLDIYPCGRYGAWEYLWSDEAMQSGRRTAESLGKRC